MVATIRIQQAYGESPSWIDIGTVTLGTKDTVPVTQEFPVYIEDTINYSAWTHIRFIVEGDFNVIKNLAIGYSSTRPPGYTDVEGEIVKTVRIISCKELCPLEKYQAPSYIECRHGYSMIDSENGHSFAIEKGICTLTDYGYDTPYTIYHWIYEPCTLDLLIIQAVYDYRYCGRTQLYTNLKFYLIWEEG